MGKLIMMIGIPGSGKSTWAKEHASENTCIISRDAIRFEKLSDGEDYFAHETEVFESFIHQIIGSLVVDEVTIADATHLNKASRAKVLSKVARFADEIEAVVIDVPLEVAFSQNDKREGRAWVKHGIIRRMFFSIEEPKKEEGFDKITIVKKEV